MSTYDPVVEAIEKRLGSWRNQCVGLGKRVVLINFALTSILIFYMSLFKMSSLVWKVIVQIQRRFLWGGANGTWKIPWVKWEEVCRPMENDGLEVKYFPLFNQALLVK